MGKKLFPIWKVKTAVYIECNYIESVYIELPIDRITYRSKLEPTPKGCIPDRPHEGESVSPILGSIYR